MTSIFYVLINYIGLIGLKVLNNGQKIHIKFTSNNIESEVFYTEKH